MALSKNENLFGYFIWLFLKLQMAGKCVRKTKFRLQIDLLNKGKEERIFRKTKIKQEKNVHYCDDTDKQ